MIFVRDKGQMCNNIFQYMHVCALALENGRSVMSMRFAYKYQYFHICDTSYHNYVFYLLGKFLSWTKLIPTITYGFDLTPAIFQTNEKRLLSNRHALVEGWSVRYFPLLFKHLDEMKRLFEFKAEISDKVSRYISGYNGGVRIGVHIRRGDYATWNNGRFFFDDKAFVEKIRQLASLLGDSKITVYICGNDPGLNKDYYIKELKDMKVCFPDGNPGEDLCLLSQCDYLIGPPSSFSLMATFYDKAKLYWLGLNEDMRLEDFHDFAYWSVRMDAAMG